jgi:glycosyltransferase involved in cell wall biosynthesis
MPRDTNEEGIAKRWRKLQNEIQMLWHIDPVNEEREQRGMPSINSLWISGIGKLSDVQAPQAVQQSQQLYGPHPLLAGLAKLFNIPHSIAFNTPAAGSFAWLEKPELVWPTLSAALSNQELDVLYANADVFVLPSLFEGYGMVFAEAMSYGLPIIATTGRAIPDTVPPEAGLLVPPGDIPNLTAALKTLIQDSSYRSRLSDGALQAASKQPTWDHASQQFATVLTHLI